MEVTILKTIILGIIQGATEFLPVSSSGHLVLAQKLFGITEGALTLSVFLHFGTLVAVVIALWDDVKGILLLKKSHRRLTFLILVGIIPTGIIGVAFKDLFEEAFNSVLVVGFMLLVTGALLWISEEYQTGRKSEEEMSFLDSIFVGLAQGLAIIPGISRSGSTIVGGFLRGLNRELAARFSFLVSLPVIFGATLLEVKDIIEMGTTGGVSITNIVIGTLAATISGYLAVRFLLDYIKKHSFKPFAYYVWGVGIIIILMNIL